MKQYFELDAKEKRLEWILLLLFILFAMTIGVGVYTQSHNMDFDRILIPGFFSISGTIFLLYGLNGVTKRNLIQKYTPFYIYNILQYLIERLGSVEKEKAKSSVANILGICGLFISVICFSIAIWDIIKHQ
jgi:hypothetical protein